MALDRISLSRFRNHRETALEGARRFNLLVGENGAGKTNVLEALSLLAPGRGLRRAPLTEMASENGDGGFAIGASLDDVRLGTQVDPARPTRRQVRINGAEASAVTLGEWLALSWLTPAMDGLFTDSAGARRRWLDRMAVALDASHAHTRSEIDRYADTSALVAAAAAGDLALDADLPAVADPGYDLALTTSDSARSLITAIGHPVELPAGEVSVTLNTGYAWNRIAITTRTQPPPEPARGG